MPDLIVIGAGYSGLSAALAAAQAGLSVRVIATGHGTTHWSAATLDLLGYLPPYDSRVDQPFEHIDALPPGHPYRLLGGDAIRAALGKFTATLADQGLEYQGAATPGDNLWLPSPIGAARPAYFAPQGQIAGDLRRGEPMLIVGFTGLRDFFPRLIAENLRKQGIPARAAFLPLDLITSRRDYSTLLPAHSIEEPARYTALGAALAKLVRPGERIGLPAILGIDHHTAVVNALQEQTQTSIFEIPTLPTSVPGVRLYRALARSLRNLGVRIEMKMSVINFATETTPAGPRIRWVETATSSRPLRHRAERFLLASGGILGGGFQSDHQGRFWESIFNLPITGLPATRSEWVRPAFLDAQGHPIFRCGLSVNRQFQPTGEPGEDGTPIYTNLWAAGTLLAHTDPIRERSLEGIAIATGIAAGRAAAGIPARSAVAEQPLYQD